MILHFELIEHLRDPVSFINSIYENLFDGGVGVHDIETHKKKGLTLIPLFGFYLIFELRYITYFQNLVQVILFSL